MIQVYFNGHCESSSFAGASSTADSEGCRSVAVLFRDAAGLRWLSSSLFSLAGVPVSLFPKSKAVPGVFGVLLALPKLANAPLPSPKAPPAPVVGLAVATGPVELNGLLPFCGVEMLPKRFAEGVWSLFSVVVGRDLSMERESLLLLQSRARSV